VFDAVSFGHFKSKMIAFEMSLIPEPKVYDTEKTPEAPSTLLSSKAKEVTLESGAWL
jgi:hypothetical protein